MSVTTRVTISSAGDEWPDGIEGFIKKLENEGFENIVNGSFDTSEALPDDPEPKKLWLVYERNTE